MADLYCILVYVPLVVGRFLTSCAAQNDYQDLTLCIVTKITLDFVCNHDHSNCAIITGYIVSLVPRLNSPDKKLGS